MAKLTGFIKGIGKSGPSVHDVISLLGQQKSAVRVEIENTPVYFYSSVSLRMGSVMMSVPKSLNSYLEKGKWVRLQLKEPEKQELRLEVHAANLAGSAERNIFYCKLPNAVLDEAKRAAIRHDTGKFRVFLELAAHPAPYRVLDLSSSGIKIRLNSEDNKSLFKVGEYLNTPARISLENKASVELQDLIPRFCSQDEVGLEMVAREGKSRTILKILLEYLDSQVKITSQQSSQSS